MAQTVNISVTGGYNGGAVISAKLDGVEWFNATGNSPYNLLYDVYIGTVTTEDGALDLLVTPPPTNTSNLTIALSGALTETINVPPNGANTSYGYNFTRDYTVGPPTPPPTPSTDAYKYDVYLGATKIGEQLIYNTYVAYANNETQLLGSNFMDNPYINNMESGSTIKFVLSNGSYIQVDHNVGPNEYQIYAYDKNGVIIGDFGANNYKPYAYVFTDNNIIVIRGTSVEVEVGSIISGFNSATTPYSDFFGGVDPVTPSDDPYGPGGYSGGGGGDGSFDLHNDSIDFPNLPTLSAVDTGLVSIYTPSLTQLKALATFLWNANPTDVDWWKKLVANPLDLILGLSIVPVQVPQGTAQTIKVGLIDTGVSVTKAASQFVTVDCGSVTIQKNCGGSALDYSPFTKFSLYLPFIGTRTISCDDIMGRTVHVKYNVDLLSGGCTAMVKITGGPEDNELDAILYQYSGACAISIPLTGETFTNMITSTIQLAASIGATVATGGAAAGVTAASAANSLMSMKPIIERAGGVSGAAGQLGIMQPYLIAEVPRQSVPENCNKFTGYPSNMKATIGSLTGYTEVDIVYLKGIEATQAELDELETILKGGFII